MNNTITITFGEIAENHVGMEKIGNEVGEGLNLKDLQRVQNCFNKWGTENNIYRLNDLLPDNIDGIDEAYFLHCKKGVDALLKNTKGDGKLYTADDIYYEQNILETDKHAKMQGRVVNKIARHNLCFSTFNREPDFENGKGSIVSWDNVPLTNHVKKCMEIIVGDKTTDLQGEGNYYYDTSKCGIKFHGDSERKIVIAFRLGLTMPLHYQWYNRFKPVGSRFNMDIDHGDIYIMSFKATGNDWKKSSKYTLRHAAGCKKYTTIKPKNKKKQK